MAFYQNLSNAADLIRWAKTRARRTSLFHAYALWKKKYGPHKIILLLGQSDVCLGGYGGSANGFVEYFIRGLEPELELAHHCHSPALIRCAIDNDIPTIINIRAPKEAIASVNVRFEGDVSRDIMNYIDFYEFVESQQSDLHVIPFEVIVGEIHRFGREVSEIIGTDWRDVDFEESERLALNRLREKSPATREEMAAPQEERDRRKKTVMEEVARHDLYPRAQAVYERVLQGLD